jgi:hypothetical protein
MTKTTRAVAIAAAASTFVTPLVLTGTAHAQSSAGVSRQGSCSGTSGWQLSAKPDDGQIEVQWEVDSNVVGQRWTVRLRDNGDLFLSGHRMTQAPSGSFSVTRSTADRVGSDVIRARSVHGDEVCHASITL